jgi:hypothetical protein
MQLEPWVPPCIFLMVWSLGVLGILFGSYCCSFYGSASSFRSFGPFSSSVIGDLVLSPMVGWEHLRLYLSGSDRASQKSAISGSCHQTFLSIYSSVVSVYGMDPQVGHSLDGLSFSLCPIRYPCTSSCEYFVPLLRMTVASILLSSFLSFIWSVYYIVGILSFWANINSRVSTYHVCSFMTGLPNSEYFLVLSICMRFNEVIFFSSWVVFHYVNIPYFLYSFLFCGISGFFPASGYYK